MKNQLTDIARKMMGGVVQIHVEGYIEEDIQSVMNPAIKILGTWSGSGFFVKYQDLEGYIVTNAHVIRNASKIEISSMLTSEEQFEAEIVGLVKQLEPDVALIKLSEKELKRFKSLSIQDIEYLELENDNPSFRGEEIKAIGYPLGMSEPNITGGEITNFISGSEYYTERFVTDAAINPGNSGGPSVNEHAKVIGLNTAIINGAENIGFITPANFVTIIMENLIQQNEPHFSGIGGKLQKNAENFNALLNQPNAKGVIVSKVYGSGFLDVAKIRPRDVILAINGIEFDRHGIVISNEGLYRHKNIYDIIKLIPIGDTVEILYQRDGELKTAKTTAIPNPEKGISSNSILTERKFLEVFGMIIQELSFDIMEAMRTIDPFAQINMVKMIDVDAPVLAVTYIHQGTQADEINFPVGELIKEVNGLEVHTLNQLSDILKSCEDGKVLMECESGFIGYFTLA